MVRTKGVRWLSIPIVWRRKIQSDFKHAWTVAKKIL